MIVVVLVQAEAYTCAAYRAIQATQSDGEAQSRHRMGDRDEVLFERPLQVSF
jgi:hypothetical protein